MLIEPGSSCGRVRYEAREMRPSRTMMKVVETDP